MISSPELPDWIEEGLRLQVKNELLKAIARDAWRRHCAHEAQKWSLAAHRTASQLGRFQEQVRNTCNSAVIYPKFESRRSV